MSSFALKRNPVTIGFKIEEVALDRIKARGRTLTNA
jgi:hypothetical protein